MELARELVGSARPLCGYEEQRGDEEVRYGPSRAAKAFFEKTTDMVEGGLEDDQ